MKDKYHMMSVDFCIWNSSWASFFLHDSTVLPVPPIEDTSLFSIIFSLLLHPWDFPGNRTISNRTKISMEPQKSLCNNFEGKKKNKFGGITLFQSHRNQNSMVLPEKQIRTSVGQNWESRNKPMYLYGKLI